MNIAEATKLLLEIGFNLYTEMLNHAVASLKQGKEPDLSQPLGVTTEINLHVPALLPADYCGDVHERLTLYKRFANCGTTEQLDGMHEELIDRFGLTPEPAQALLESHRLRILGKPLGILRIDATETHIQLQFVPKPPIDPARVFELIQKSRGIKLNGPDKLRVEAAHPKLNDRVAHIKQLFKSLQ